MTSEPQFLRVFGRKILSLNFVQNDGGAFHSDSDAVQ